jgi:hypothetical protein
MTIHVAPSIITDRSPGRPAKAARTAAEARARMRRDVVVCWSPPAGSYAMQLNTDSCSAEHDWPSHSTFLKNGRPEPAAEIMGFGSFANSLFHFDGDNVSTAWQGSVREPDHQNDRLKFRALILNLRLENVAAAVAAYASSASLRFFPFLCNLLGRSLLCCSFPFG